MKIKKHPHFISRWTKIFFILSTVMAIGIGSLVYLGANGNEQFVDQALPPLFVIISVLFIILSVMPFRVLCAHCGGKTKTKMFCPELRDHWSAYCPKCDILWDLGLGNDD